MLLETAPVQSTDPVYELMTADVVLQENRAEVPDEGLHSLSAYDVIRAVPLQSPVLYERILRPRALTRTNDDEDQPQASRTNATATARDEIRTMLLTRAIMVVFLVVVVVVVF